VNVVVPPGRGSTYRYVVVPFEPTPRIDMLEAAGKALGTMTVCVIPEAAA
jgi:hypothetical protein